MLKPPCSISCSPQSIQKCPSSPFSSTAHLSMLLTGTRGAPAVALRTPCCLLFVTAAWQCATIHNISQCHGAWCAASRHISAAHTLPIWLGCPVIDYSSGCLEREQNYRAQKDWLPCQRAYLLTMWWALKASALKTVNGPQFIETSSNCFKTYFHCITRSLFSVYHQESVLSLR